jgi:hypothetical protein
MSTDSWSNWWRENKDTIDDDPKGVDDIDTVGATSMDEVQSALTSMIDATLENRFPPHLRVEFEVSE